MRFRFWVFSATLALIGCGQDSGAGETASAECDGDGIVVVDAWTEPARAGQAVSAAYMTLCNGGDTDDALVGVSFAGADAVEIHLSSMEDGVMRMTPISALALPAGQSVSLSPGGAHVMLIGVTDTISANSPPSFTLQFETAPDASVTVDIRTAKDHSGHH